MINDSAYLAIINEASSEVQTIAIAIRKKILELHPDATEVIWEISKEAGYGFGEEKLTEHHTRILFNKNHVNLMFEHGASLVDKDPMSLFEGNAKKCRHVKLKHIEDIDNPDLEQLIMVSIEDRRLALKL